MINVYTIENGAYYCEAQFKEYNTDCIKKVKELLRVYPPQQIVISKGNDVIKRQYERMVDGI